MFTQPANGSAQNLENNPVAFARNALGNLARQFMPKCFGASRPIAGWVAERLQNLGLTGAIAVALISWHVMHRNMPPAAQAYTKVLRAARLLGAGRPRWQTPAEFATSLGGLMPGMAESAALIALEYEQERYARGNPNSDADGLAGHWRKVLRGLIGYRARMIVGGSPRTAQDQRGA